MGPCPCFISREGKKHHSLGACKIPHSHQRKGRGTERANSRSPTGMWSMWWFIACSWLCHTALLDSGHLPSIPVLCPMGPRESQALLTSFQLPPLTRVPDVPLLKTACDPDTAAPLLPPFLAILDCVGSRKSTDLGRPL